jgi:hypothetical protein
MYIFDIKKYPNYKRRNLELINYGSSVLIKEQGNTPLYLCFNNICLKSNTQYYIYMNFVSNLNDRNLYLELKSGNNILLKKKIESHHFNNYFIFNSGYNNNVVISLYSKNNHPNKFLRFFNFVIFECKEQHCQPKPHCNPQPHCQPICNNGRYEEPLNIVKTYDVNLNNRFSEVYNIYNDSNILVEPSESTFVEKTNENITFYSYKYDKFLIEPDLTEVDFELNRCYYINLIVFFNTPCVDMKIKILDGNDNLIAEKKLDGFLKTTFKVINTRFNDIRLVFTNGKEINNKKLIVYWFNILRENTCEEIQELDEQHNTYVDYDDIQDDEPINNLITIPNPIYYFNVFESKLNDLSIVDCYSHFSEYSKTLEIINHDCKNGKILTKVVPKNILIDGEGSYLVKVTYENNYNPDINCYIYQNNTKIGPEDSLIDISNEISQYYLFNLETTTNILICLYFTKKYKLSANIKELSILQLNNLEGSISRLDFPISYLDQSGNPIETWNSMPTGYPSICDNEKNKIKINNYCKLNKKCEPEVYVGKGFEQKCNTGNCHKKERYNEDEDFSDNCHFNYNKLNKYSALVEKHKLEDKINLMKEYIININCFNLRDKCQLNYENIKCKEVNEFICFINENQNVNLYYSYLTELEILEQYIISLQNTIKELYNINKKNKSIVIQCSNNLMSEMDRTNNQEIIDKNIQLMKDINKTFVYKNEEVLTKLTDTIIEYKYEYPKCTKVFVEYLVIYANNIDEIVYKNENIDVLTLENTLKSVDIINNASKKLQKDINLYNTDNTKLCYLINFIKEKIEYVNTRCSKLIEISKDRVSHLITSLQRKIEFLDLKIK